MDQMALDGEFEDFWVEVGRFPRRTDAEQHALVLIASGVASRMVESAAGFALFVAAADAVRARSEMALYQQENRPPQRASRAALRPLRAGLDAALVYCLVLVFIHAAVNRGAFGADWLDIGNAEAGLIRGGA